MYIEGTAAQFIAAFRGNHSDRMQVVMGRCIQTAGKTYSLNAAGAESTLGLLPGINTLCTVAYVTAV